MLAHFTIGDQFLGFSGSSVSGSAHHTITSDGEAGVGAVVAVGMGLLEKSSGVCEGAILVLQWCATRNQTSLSATNEGGLLERPKSTGASAWNVKPSPNTALPPTGA